MLAVDAIPYQLRTLARGVEVVSEGDDATVCIVVLNGLLATSKVNEFGKRQTTALHVKGDMPDLMGLHLDKVDHDVRTITQSTVARISSTHLSALCAEYPRIAASLWRTTLIDASIVREWVVNVGSRPAANRLAHLMCEMMMRLDAAGLASDGTCALELSQMELSDATGLSTVHVNRSLQYLRGEGPLSFVNGVLTIHDQQALSQFGGFSPEYLHLALRKGRLHRYAAATSN